MQTPVTTSVHPTASDTSNEGNSTRERFPADFVAEVADYASDPASSARLVAETTTNAPRLDSSNFITKQTPISNLETEPKPMLSSSTEGEGTETLPRSKSDPCEEIRSDSGSDGEAYDVDKIDFGYDSSKDADSITEVVDNVDNIDNITDDDDAWEKIRDQGRATDDALLLEYPYSMAQRFPLPVETLLLINTYIHSRADLLQFMLTCKMAVSVLCKDIWEQPVISSLTVFKLLWRTAVESRVLQTFPFFNLIHTIKIDAEVPVGDDDLFDVLERCQNLQVLDVSGNQNVSSTSISQVSASCPKLRELILACCGRVEMSVLSSRLASSNGWESVKISPSVLVVIDFSETRLSDEDVEKITSHFSFLEQINFSKCRSLTNSSLLHIAHNCTALRKLAMSKTRVSDDGIEALCFHSRNGRTVSPRHTLTHVEFNSSGITRHAFEILVKNCNALKRVELSCRWITRGGDWLSDEEETGRDKFAFQQLQLRLAPESGEDYPRNPEFASRFPLESLLIRGGEVILDMLIILVGRSSRLQQLTLEVLNLSRRFLELIARSDSIEELSIHCEHTFFSETVSAIVSQTQLRSTLKDLTYPVTTDPNPVRSLFRLAQSCPNLCSVQFKGYTRDTRRLERFRPPNSFEKVYEDAELLKMRQFDGDLDIMSEDELKGILEEVAA
ncbi:hypothetical protein HDU81_010988 [Chytriomyces hyalinus]|nr:hypothetical protein HDU81_010988 [Chytriomyces hyalinus]